MQQGLFGPARAIGSVNMCWVHWGTAIEPYVTSLAIIVGGIWTYRKFIRHRLGLPIIDLTLTQQELMIECGWILRVDIVIKNIGSSLAKFESAELRMRQVLPLPERVLAGVRDGCDPVDDGEVRIEWPCLAQRLWDAKTLGFEVEPGESGSLHADFFVPSHVTAIELYYFLANPKKKRTGVGWSKSAVHQLPLRKDVGNGDSGRKEAPDRAGEAIEASGVPTAKDAEDPGCRTEQG